jgi:hypothetical protein
MDLYYIVRYPTMPTSRTIEKTGYILLALFLLIMGASGFVRTDTANVNSLHVPFTPQIASNWCWVATTTMILQYESRTNANIVPLTQCQYVKAYYKSQNAYVDKLWMLDSLPLSDSALYYFNGPGNPFIDSVGHDYTQTNLLLKTQKNGNTIQDGVPLTYSQLQAECIAGRPVIFGWQWQGLTQATKENNGAHFLLVEGTPYSSYFNGENGWVSIHDPLPVGRGRHRIIRYSEYANKRLMEDLDNIMYAYNRHYYDTYNITFVGK